MSVLGLTCHMPRPAIGSKEYRALSFKEQLEIVSLKFFCPESYETIDSVGSEDYSGLSWSIDYPDIPPLSVIGFPVSILKNYWAGYTCYYMSKWYLEDYKGLTPLDDFGINSRKLVNIWAFTFPMLSLESSLYYVFSWLVKEFKNSSRVHLLLLASKVYSYLYLKLRDISQFEIFHNSSVISPYRLVSEAMEEYKDIRNFTSLNFMFPIIEECYELTWFQYKELVLHEQPKKYDGRWYFPLIPAGLFTAANFRIGNWQFLK